MKLFFTIWNVFIQDGNFDELEVDKSFSECFELNNLNNIRQINASKTSFNHIENNFYVITAYVYRVTEDSIFIDVDGVSLTIDNREEYNILTTSNYYNFEAYISCDIWNWFGLSSITIDKYYDEVKIEGIVKSIHVDTSKYIQISQREWIKIGVNSQYDIKIQKTSCWDDENYSNGSIYYLVELDVDNKNKNIPKEII